MVVRLSRLNKKINVENRKKFAENPRTQTVLRLSKPSKNEPMDSLQAALGRPVKEPAEKVLAIGSQAAAGQANKDGRWPS